MPNHDSDGIRDLRERLEMLEKLMGSRNSIGDEKGNNPEKLPMIKRPFKAKEK